MKNVDIKKRKMEHLEIFKHKDIYYRSSSGFEKYRLLHNSLPEQDFDEIDIGQEFLGYNLSMPFMISAITGGTKEGKKLNGVLSEIASQHKIAFTLGSLRPCFENESLITSFADIKKQNPNIPVIGNIGGQQLLEYSIGRIKEIIESIEIDALSIHLNPIQEVLQPDGDKKFVGIRQKIIEIARALSKPIIIKEVGFGLPIKNILELAQGGIKWFDIAGTGGTSWAKIEKFRNSNPIKFQTAREFDEFGIPTAELLEKAMMIENVNIIASGGINQALDFAKAIAMGAQLCGSAGKILENWNAGEKIAVDEMLEVYKQTLKTAVFITGCKNLKFFREINNIEKC